MQLLLEHVFLFVYMSTILYMAMFLKRSTLVPMKLRKLQFSELFSLFLSKQHFTYNYTTKYYSFK